MNCEDCQKVFTQPLTNGSIFTFSKTVYDLEEASKRGCTICHLQYCLIGPGGGGMRNHMERKASHETMMRFCMNVPPMTARLSFHYRCPDSMVEHRMGNLLLHQVPASWEKRHESLDGRGRWDIARWWMDTCDKEHELCVLTTPSGFLPTRLVCTGLAGDKIRMVKNVDLAPGTKFCTLSHCWGGYMPLKLQHDNFACLSQEIPHEELSNTFKDALHIARRLGMSYIWIDSLCIIQDDPQDWTRESSLMAQIYETSALNIAATRSPSGREGCLPLRPPHTTAQPPLFHALDTWSSPSAQPTDPPAGGEEAQLWTYTAESELWAGEIERSPLLSRGWVFQELKIARRVLHCGAGQLFWRCKALCASEAFPDGIPGTGGSGGGEVVAGGGGEDGQGGQRDGDGRFRAWHGLVEQYSRLQLTYPEKDRLVAIEGVARRMAPLLGLGPRFGHEYLAGLWRCNLARDLLWRVSSVEQSSSSSSVRDEGVSASLFPHPSWSWSSCTRGIDYFDFPSEETYCADDAVRAALADIDTKRCDDHVGDSGDVVCKQRAISMIVCVGRGTDSGSSEDLDCEVEALANWGFARYLDRDGEMPSSDSIYVPVVLKKASDHDVRVGGLMLRPTDVKGQYRRIGYMTMVSESGDIGKDWTRLWHGGRGAAVEYGEDCGVNAFGAKRWRITLV